MTLTTQRRNRNQHTIRVAAALALLLAAALAILALPEATTNARLQGAVAPIAAGAPDTAVRVIAQKADDSDAAAQRVRDLGGAVVKELTIINAIVAELDVAAVAELDASPAVRWVSVDGLVAGAGKPPKGPSLPLPEAYYLDTLGVQQVWDMGYTGEGVAIAIVDSGVARLKDFQINPNTGNAASRLREQLVFSSGPVSGGTDVNGHGTHVAGIAAGSGWESGGAYSGVAPQADLISLRVSDDDGMSFESDVVEALQWILDNKDAYNIRVVNLSINAADEASYHSSPLDAAAEILWFNGIVVIASAGNSGEDDELNTANAAPANDPFLITVGASDQQATALPLDDTVAPFSAYGTTDDGHVKPDIIAPGKDIISVLAGSASDWRSGYPERVVDVDYFRASGTSMSAPMVAGTVALMLQAQPELTPDQVKYRLLNANGRFIVGVPGDTLPTGLPRLYPYLDVYAVVTATTTESANSGLEASQLLWTGDEPVTWGSVNWNSVNWNSVNWNSVNWNSVNWNSVNWNSVNWNE